MNELDLNDAVSKTMSLAKREDDEAVNALIHAVTSEVSWAQSRGCRVRQFQSHAARSEDGSQPSHGCSLGRSRHSRSAFCRQRDVQGHRERKSACTGSEARGLVTEGGDRYGFEDSEHRRSDGQEHRRSGGQERHNELDEQGTYGREGLRTSPRTQGRQGDDNGGDTEDRQARPGQEGREARPGEQSNKAIGQKGRQARPGE